MRKLEFRPLRADEIECRVGTTKKDASGKVSGFSLLLYKDARVDQRLLDEVVGAFNWQRKHTRDNANCIVSIYDEEKKMWVEKEDVGTESNTEKEKGLASDSFKRACFNWGIGRELYDSPFIWIKADSTNSQYDKYEVKEIVYDETRKVSRLVIANARTKAEVFTFGVARSATKAPSTPKPQPQPKVEAKKEEPIKTFEDMAKDIMTATSRETFDAKMRAYRKYLSQPVITKACQEMAKKYPKPTE